MRCKLFKFDVNSIYEPNKFNSIRLFFVIWMENFNAVVKMNLIYFNSMRHNFYLRIRPNILKNWKVSNAERWVLFSYLLLFSHENHFVREWQKSVDRLIISGFVLFSRCNLFPLIIFPNCYSVYEIYHI